MQCEMCGQKFDSLFLTEIEGVNLNVCKDCSKFGKTIRRVSEVYERQKQKRESKSPAFDTQKPEVMEYIINDYSIVIKNAREKSGLTQKVFAMRLNEKESLINSIERGKRKPSLELARKLEKFLEIRLVDQLVVDEAKSKQKVKAEGLTIGDIISIKSK